MLRHARNVFGFSISQLTLDKFTLSEVLRLHLGSSGAPGIIKNIGNMDSAEDPGLEFRIRNSHILDTLRRESLFELSVVDKLKLLRVLVEQLLATDGVRDMIEEAAETHRSARVELRKLRVLARPGPAPDDRPQVSPREFERREQELKQKLRSSQEKIMMAPLGEDRAYRRYYLSYSIPAVIIEDDAVNISNECMIGGTPKQRMTNHTPAFMRQFLQNSGKLNVTTSTTTTTPTPLKQTTIVTGNNSVKSEQLSRTEEERLVSTRLTCTGDKQTCYVHNRGLQRKTWRFIASREQLDELIAGLDERGVREKALKAALNKDIENLRWAIDKTPLSMLNATLENGRKVKLPSQLIRDSALYGVVPCFALELSFREILLGLEERITAGNLGYLKGDREVWRMRMIEILNAVDEKKTAAEINALRPTTPMHEVIDQLCDALIEVGHSVEKKVLMPPLGEAEPPSKSKKKKDEREIAASPIKANILTWIREIKPAETKSPTQVNGVGGEVSPVSRFTDSSRQNVLYFCFVPHSYLTTY